MDQRARRILEEVIRRAEIKRSYDQILEDLIEPAKAVARSTARKKAIQVSRRGAKSYSVCSILLHAALTKDKENFLYLALTSKNVERIAWETFMILLEKYKIPFKSNKVSHTIFLDNGSTIEMAGADGSIALADRFLGAHFSIIAIDESGSFSPEILDYLIDVVLGPTLMDTLGTIYLLGSPQAVERGKFYEACHGEGGYEHFSWLTSENQYMAKQYYTEIEELKKINPEIEESAWFKRNFLNQWVTDASDLVYTLKDYNIIDTFPVGERLMWLGGMDLGFNDDTSFIVGLVNKHDNTLYIIDEYKKSGMLHDEIAAKIKEFEAKYKGISFKCDPAWALSLNELRVKYQCSIVPAKKGNKKERIEAINTEFILKNIKILSSCIETIKEMRELTRHIKKGKNRDEWVENPAMANHLCDALSYAWIESPHMFQQPKPSLEEIEAKKERDYIKMANSGFRRFGGRKYYS